jgi:seryl-tRNA synthetase
MLSISFSNTTPLSESQIKAFKERVSYISSKIISCNFSKDLIQIFFDKKINILEKKKIILSCQKLISRIKLINIISNEKVIFENYLKIFNKKNIFQYLKKINSIKNISPGIFTLRGKFLKHFDKLNSFLISRSSSKKYEKIHVHSMLPLQSFLRNGYLLNFPHHIMFASHVKRDLKFIDQVSALKKLTKINRTIDKPELVISPTVCYHIFETFKDSNFNTNKVFDSISSCNRFESINYLTFERLQSFTMREFVGFGSPMFIKKFLQDNINYFKEKFIKNKIRFKIITANDQFFSQQGIKKMAYQSLNDLKFEFQFWLPYEKKWLSVGSFNNHLDILVKKYNIKYGKNKLYSGCIGWGYERFIYAIISQGKNLNY